MNRSEFRTVWRLSKDDFTNKQVDQIMKMVERESRHLLTPYVARAVDLICGPRVTYRK